MRFWYRLQTGLSFIAFAFYPATSLLLITGLLVVLVTVIGIVMAQVIQGTVTYDILLALITGVVASGIVSFTIELSNNYKSNKLAWYELHDFCSTIMDFDQMKHVLLNNASNGDTDKTESKDLIQITWQQLPKIMPILKETFDNRKAFLSNKEIDTLQDIMLCYNQIYGEVQQRLNTSLLHNVMNHPDEGFLSCIYPKNILDDMPDWIKRSIAKKESNTAIDRLTDSVMNDSFILGWYMKDYTVSMSGLDSNHCNQDAENDSIRAVDIDENCGYDSSEDEMDEETFKSRNEAFGLQMEPKFRPFVSWHISKCCEDIYNDINLLERVIRTKPYYGMMMRLSKKQSTVAKYQALK